MVILDTCGLIELYQPLPNLKEKTLQQIREGAYILSISFAEIACKIKINKLKMDTAPIKIYKELLEISSIKIIDIGVEEWLNSIELAWEENRDPADRVIVAFAKSKDVPIVTCDKKIKDFYKKTLW